MSARAKWVACVALLVPCIAVAQSMPAPDMSSMPGMEMGEQKPAVPAKAKPVRKKAKPAAPAMDHGSMHHDDAAPTAASSQQPPAAMDHGAMHHATQAMSPDTPAPTHEGHVETPVKAGAPGAPGDPAAMDMGGAMKPMQGGPPPADARDPDAYADGLAREHPHGMDMDDDAKYLYVLVDRLETVHTRDGHGQALDAQAWYGGDVDKLWLKVDGERSDGRLGATRTEALWNHAFASYWGWQAGLRQDFGDGPGRTWASVGVQGLAPYWFDLQATAYVGEGGRTALRLETEYDLHVTQRLVLQPDVKVDVYGRDDPRRGVGAGLSQVEAGLRLRYELSRKFAPYVGVVWNRTLGNTARFARAADEPVRRIEAVAGVRFWFRRRGACPMSR